MLNDITTPPVPPESEDEALSVTPVPQPRASRPATVVRSPVATSPAQPLVDDARPHVDPAAPGRHLTRTVGEPTRTDPIYATPMEDRASNFSLSLSIAVIVIFVVLILFSWLAMGWF